MPGPYDFWEAPPENPQFENPMFQDWRFVIGWGGLEAIHGLNNNAKKILETLSHADQTHTAVPMRGAGGRFAGRGDVQSRVGSPRHEFWNRAKSGEYNYRVEGRTRGAPGKIYHQIDKPHSVNRGGTRTAAARGTVESTLRDPHMLNRTTGADPLTGGPLSRELQLHSNVQAKYGSRFATRSTIYRNFRAMSKVVWWAGALELGFMATEMAAKAIVGVETGRNGKYAPRELELGDNFIDTRHAQTQRARAVQAIHNSHLSTRAVLGNEASMMHYR